MRDVHLSLLHAMTSGPVASAPVTAVAHLDLERYAGTWHEIARLPMYFQRKCTGAVTATYTPRPDETVAVENRCDSSEGPLVAQGVARRPEPFSRGKLEVSFAPRWLRWLPMVWADYWVLALDEDYQWAMVGQPGRKYLWILSRTPTLSPEVFESLKEKALAMGYNLGTLIVAAGQE
ncbi:lipocalin family protein [Rothia nasimurium]|uniref:Outer membrane lipoprotein Blc n=1 Tax=Luteibacter anthropi TaxID=564369 RepID=A0A7X5UDZ1_9GAMM|nr:lipocalin family protein [Luteibacter anthropi]NII08745.1 lipocalin family protein [Luteibacter anthropi]